MKQKKTIVFTILAVLTFSFIFLADTFLFFTSPGPTDATIFTSIEEIDDLTIKNGELMFNLSEKDDPYLEDLPYIDSRSFICILNHTKIYFFAYVFANENDAEQYMENISGESSLKYYKSYKWMRNYCVVRFENKLYFVKSNNGKVLTEFLNDLNSYFTTSVDIWTVP